MPKLWRYNLHYFDYLKNQGLSPDDKVALIDDWISRIAPGKGDGWEPYPLSLRVVNWLKFVVDRPPNAVSRVWLESLSLQLASLRAGMEHHLLGNHLLKNLKALLFGGVAFSGPTADDWLQCGLQLLRRETGEQVLPDGGHFERSPMYHCIVLEDHLDLVNLLSAHPSRVQADDMQPIIDAARRSTEFLRTIVGGDDEFPLFNDAAFGIAPDIRLLDYADSVLASAKDFAHELPNAANQPLRILLPDSGFFGYRYGGDSLILDCGHVGPDHQPGHAHCDTLSFELCVGSHRIVVDSGVFDYEIGAMRDYVRSTQAHNTLMVDGVEQSEIWGAFRVARRALAPFRNSVNGVTDNCGFGAHMMAITGFEDASVMSASFLYTRPGAGRSMIGLLDTASIRSKVLFTSTQIAVWIRCMAINGESRAQAFRS